MECAKLATTFWIPSSNHEAARHRGRRAQEDGDWSSVEYVRLCAVDGYRLSGLRHGHAEERQGRKIACPEEIAFQLGYIDAAQLTILAQPLLKSGYGEYLLGLL